MDSYEWILEELKRALYSVEKEVIFLALPESIHRNPYL